jgi:hypothetical protein
MCGTISRYGYVSQLRYSTYEQALKQANYIQLGPSLKLPYETFVFMNLFLSPCLKCPMTEPKCATAQMPSISIWRSSVCQQVHSNTVSLDNLLA